MALPFRKPGFPGWTAQTASQWLYRRGHPRHRRLVCHPHRPLPAGHLAAFADGAVKGFLDHAIWVRCHSTPSRSFLEPPIFPAYTTFLLKKRHSSTCASASSACGAGLRRPRPSRCLAARRRPLQGARRADTGPSPSCAPIRHHRAAIELPKVELASITLGIFRNAPACRVANNAPNKSPR